MTAANSVNARLGMDFLYRTFEKLNRHTGVTQGHVEYSGL